jgi:hypothetical protein
MSDDDYAHRFLEFYRERFEAGDKWRLLYCVEWCLTNNVPAPAWLKHALRNACAAARSHKIKSWDEVFGRPLKKGQRQATARRNARIAHEVSQQVEERHKAGEALDKELFHAVGREFGVGGTVASELYYGMLKEFVETSEEDDVINQR